MNYLVTGGTDGIGCAIVKRIMSTSNSAKDRVFVVYGHDDKKAQELIDDFPIEEQEKIVLMKYDLSDESVVEELVGRINDEVDGLDYFISNIGIGEYAKFDDYTMEMWNKVFSTNLTIPIFLIQKLKDKMNNNGSVLLMGSYAGIKAYSSSVVYSLSKAGLIFASKVLVKELEKYGVRINAVAPGFIETKWQKGRSDESRNRICAKIAQHRFGTPEEVAKMAFDVMTNEYMNGSIVEIHGGYEYF